MYDPHLPRFGAVSGGRKNPKDSEGLCHQLNRNVHTGFQIQLIFRKQNCISSIMGFIRMNSNIGLDIPPWLFNMPSPRSYLLNLRHAHIKSRHCQQLVLGSHTQLQAKGSLLLF